MYNSVSIKTGRIRCTLVVQFMDAVVRAVVTGLKRRLYKTDVVPGVAD